MLDTANIAYGALPIRLHVIRDGKVAYEGRSGPTGYDMKDVKRWLTRNCATVSSWAAQYKLVKEECWIFLSTFRGDNQDREIQPHNNGDQYG